MSLKPSLASKLDRILSEARRWREAVPRGASDAEISVLEARCRAELRYPLQEQHAAFLRTVDGLDFNGFLIYGAGRTSSALGSFVDVNLLWRDDPSKAEFVIMAESGIDLFGHCPVTGELFCADRTGLDVMERYASVDDLIEAVLDRMIDD